jgi:hypothetical protein
VAQQTKTVSALDLIGQRVRSNIWPPSRSQRCQRRLGRIFRFIFSSSCDAVSVQETAFQRSLPFVWQPRQTSVTCPPLLPAAFGPPSATLAVRVSLSAIPECIHRHLAGCGAHGHPAAGSEYGRRATRTSTIAHNTRRLLVPNEIRSHICTSPTAGLTDKPRLDVGQPDLIWPAVTADGDRV